MTVSGRVDGRQETGGGETRERPSSAAREGVRLPPPPDALAWATKQSVEAVVFPGVQRRPSERPAGEWGSPAMPIQREAAGSVAEAIRGAVAHGLRAPAGQLPFVESIQRSFGRHDVTGVAAHHGSAAEASARALAATAYATGEHTVFARPPDLRTAAHEAAHVVQQRSGVALEGGIGAVGDAYERHADSVAEMVVQGRSAEAALDRIPGGRPRSPALLAAAQPVVQRLAGADAEVATHRAKRQLLNTAWQAATWAKKAANNSGTYDALAARRDALNDQYAADMANLGALAAGALAAKDPPFEKLAAHVTYVDGYYSTAAKAGWLKAVDTYNTATHANSVKVLWNRWLARMDTADAQTSFDELYESIKVVAWDADGGGADGTSNPTLSKRKLGGMQAAVLDGLVNNAGNLRANLGRGVHNTNPTTGGGGGNGTEYNAKTDIAPGVADWAKNAQQPNPVGAERFVKFQGKWFYSPKHYLPAAPAAGIRAAYQLVIDATV